MTEITQDFFEDLNATAARIDKCLDDLLNARASDGEVTRPQQLLAAMRHGALNGGKRLRPFLVLKSTALFGGNDEAALRVAAALECVHSYSLVHDDLPAMDDDELRRGQPTVHIAFDEATAILAGDALLTLAFDIIASDETEIDPLAKLELISKLARAAGIGGMVGGQILDIAAETKTPDETGIIRLQAMKTGALLRFSCEARAIISRATREDRERMGQFGETIGLAFQLADDLLDVTADSETMGKATGKDAARGKGTLVGLHGVDWAREQLRGLVNEAESILTGYGPAADVLRATSRFIAERQN